MTSSPILNPTQVRSLFVAMVSFFSKFHSRRRQDTKKSISWNKQRSTGQSLREFKTQGESSSFKVLHSEASWFTLIRLNTLKRFSATYAIREARITWIRRPEPV